MTPGEIPRFLQTGPSKYEHGASIFLLCIRIAASFPRCAYHLNEHAQVLGVPSMMS